MEVAKRAVRAGFVMMHPAALAARNSQGQLALTEPSQQVIASRCLNKRVWMGNSQAIAFMRASR